MIYFVLLILAVIVWAVIRKQGNREQSITKPPNIKSSPAFERHTIHIDVNEIMKKGIRPREKRQNVEYRPEGWVKIEKPSFFGEYSKSPSSVYAIAWSDSDPGGGVGGYRKKGHGPYILLQRQEILLKGKIQRPNDGKVANNGTFIFNDWMFGEGLKGTFYAYTRAGELLIKKAVKANLFNNGLSDDGRYACYQTCNADSEDGNMFFLYDLHTKRLITRFWPPSGWAKEYRFDSTRQVVFFDYGEGKVYRYTFDGNFLDESEWLVNREKNATGYLALSIAEEKLKTRDSSNLDDYKDIFALVEKAKIGGISAHTEAKIKRTLGEICLMCGDNNKAIILFEEALALNEKVGVKKLLAKLKAM